MIETKKFIRKPFYVEAVQVTSENLEAVAEWCVGDVRHAQSAQQGTDDEEGQAYIKVRVYRPLNERQTKAFVGDWILYAGTGFKVYSATAFAKSFEPEAGGRKNYRDAGTGQFVTHKDLEENPDTTVGEKN